MDKILLRRFFFSFYRRHEYVYLLQLLYRRVLRLQVRVHVCVCMLACLSHLVVQSVHLSSHDMAKNHTAVPCRLFCYCIKQASKLFSLHAPYLTAPTFCLITMVADLRTSRDLFVWEVGGLSFPLVHIHRATTLSLHLFAEVFSGYSAIPRSFLLLRE